MGCRWCGYWRTELDGLVLSTGEIVSMRRCLLCDSRWRDDEAPLDWTEMARLSQVRARRQGHHCRAGVRSGGTIDRPDR